MRKVSKGKREKSESSSDVESEANGESVDATEEDAKATIPNDDESAPKSKRRASKVRDKSIIDETENKGEEEDGIDASNISRHENINNGNNSKIGDKRQKKNGRKPSTPSQNNDSDQEYEVEKIVAERTIKGRRQFLVRWKGYNADDDSWENEKDLNCSQLIEDFLLQSGSDKNEKPEKNAKSNRLKTPKRGRPPKQSRKRDREDVSENNESHIEKPSDAKRTRKSKQYDAKKNDLGEEKEREFEVEKIIDVHFKKNKAREFLIRWKGFAPADDTWEPEANLNCPELISKFMDKVDKAKILSVRELRTNPSHTKRYTLTMHNKERRLSRRNLGKERATYHQCDD